MKGFSTCAMQDLVLDAPKARASDSTMPIWLLNLDQVESGSGRVLKKEFVAPDDLGPSVHRFETGTVLYSKLRPYLNKVVVADQSGYATTELVPMRCDTTRVVPHYLAYFLRSPRFLKFASNVVAGAKMPRMVMSEFWKYEVPIPYLDEQHRIAAILGKADALRAKRREALIHLNSLRQSIFLEMFGDPGANLRGWPTRPLSALIVDADSVNYGVIQPGDDVADGVPLVRVGDLVDGGVRHESLKRIAPTIESSYTRSRLQGDEILLSCVGSVGVVALVSPRERNFNIARAVARIRLSQLANRQFVAAQLAAPSVQRYFHRELRTVSQPTLNIKQIAETQLIYPPVALQEEFAERLDKIVNMRVNAQIALSFIDGLFSSIQHRAFTGTL